MKMEETENYIRQLRRWNMALLVATGAGCAAAWFAYLSTGGYIATVAAVTTAFVYMAFNAVRTYRFTKKAKEINEAIAKSILQAQEAIERGKRSE